VAVIGNRIYVAGGLASSGSVADFDVFDTDTRTWTKLPSMPTARDHLTAQAIGGKIYAIAGRAGRDFNVNEEFDPTTSNWRTRAPIPTARGGLGSGTLNGRIQVFGGEGNSGTPQGTFRQNEEYDPAVDEWRTLAPMPTPRHGLYGATFEGRIFAPSGGPVAGANFTNVHEAFYLPPAQAPAIAQEGVRNAASFEPVLAPGSLVSLFGERLSFGQQASVRLPLPVRMNAVTVEVNATPVPLIYTGPNQINFLLPENLPVGNASIKVTNAGSESNTLTASITEAAPGIFMLDQQGQGAVLIGGTGLIARPAQDASSRPARLGEVIEIYGTGLGRIDTVFVSIGGMSAEILYSGPAPGYPGLFQVNARISRNASTGNAVPVTIRAGLRTSNTVTIAVSE
ncbi:MAG: kelch repeat-containing protein, partial [Bryobacteraceae bacterium]